jgi:hypothetical protein
MLPMDFESFLRMLYQQFQGGSPLQANTFASLTQPRNRPMTPPTSPYGIPMDRMFGGSGVTPLPEIIDGRRTPLPGIIDSRRGTAPNPRQRGGGGFVTPLPRIIDGRRGITPPFVGSQPIRGGGVTPLPGIIDSRRGTAPNPRQRGGGVTPLPRIIGGAEEARRLDERNRARMQRPGETYYTMPVIR